MKVIAHNAKTLNGKVVFFSCPFSGPQKKPLNFIVRKYHLVTVCPRNDMIARARKELTWMPHGKGTSWDHGAD